MGIHASEEGSCDPELEYYQNTIPDNEMAQTATPQFPAVNTAPLSAALADPTGGQLQNGDHYRRYRSGVMMRLPDHGSYSTEARSIFYEVGRHRASARDLLQPPPEAAIPVDCSIDINPSEAASFEGVARRYSNFSPQWVKMDLAAVVERLAMSVAAVSIYGGIDTTAMRGGLPLRVTALGTLDSPQTASIASVFIPRTVDTIGNDNVFAVLVAAVNGSGSAVTTDVVRLDANTNQPLVPSVGGPQLATACVEALRMLGANYETSGGGDVFAYAVTRGIHRAVSVVAHTDEGGFMRNLFRTGRFRAPYGGINQALRVYPGLPVLASASAPAIAAWVDAIALKTAAAVGHCDPLVPGAGGWYPTVFTATNGELMPPGSAEEEPTDADARTIGRFIAADIGRFAPLYIGALTSLFAMRSISGVAEGHFATVAQMALEQRGAVDRHLKHKTVAPYFWVEPTSLLAVDQFGTLAEAEGYGSKVTAGGEASIPCFEDYSVLEKGVSANHATVAFRMRTARTSGLVSALAAEPAPLTGLRLYQYDTSSIVLPGDNGPTNGIVRDKHAAADPVSSYLWTRGQSCFPAPAEFMNTQGVYGAKLSLVTWDDDWNATLSELPEDGEMGSVPILFRVSIPSGLATGPSNAGDRGAKRARSRAAIALSQSLLRMRGGLAVSPTMEVSDVPPSLGPVTRPTRFEDTEANTGPRDPGQTSARGESGGARVGGTVRGAPVPPVAHYMPQRAPRLAGQLGGAAAPPPPPPSGPPPPPGGPGGPNQGPPGGSGPTGGGAEPLPQFREGEGVLSDLATTTALLDAPTTPANPATDSATGAGAQ